MIQNNACIFQKTQKTQIKVAQREFGLLFLVSMLHIYIYINECMSVCLCVYVYVCPYYHGNHLYIILRFSSVCVSILPWQPTPAGDRMFVCLCVCPLVTMVVMDFEAILITTVGCRATK